MGQDPAPPTRVNRSSNPAHLIFCRESDLPESSSAPSDCSDTLETTTMPSETKRQHATGLQSISDAPDDAFPSPPLPNEVGPQDASPSPSDSSTSTSSVLVDSPLNTKKRKANPVHPKIAAAGQRIISSETVRRPSSSYSRGPPATPSLKERFRAISGSRPSRPTDLTPPEIAHTSDEIERSKSESPRSLRLSDDDSIGFDDSASQVMLSSSGEEEDGEPDAPTDEQTTDNAHSALARAPVPLRMPSVPLLETERVTRFSGLGVLIASRDIAQASKFMSSIPGASRALRWSEIVRHERKLMGSEGSVICTTKIRTGSSLTPKQTEDCTAALPSTAQSESIGSSDADYEIRIEDASLLLEAGQNEGVLEKLLLESADFTADGVNSGDGELTEALNVHDRGQIDLMIWLHTDSTSIERDDDLLKRFERLTNVVLLKPVSEGASSPSTEELPCYEMTRNPVLGSSGAQLQGKVNLQELAQTLFSPAAVQHYRLQMADKLVALHRRESDRTVKMPGASDRDPGPALSCSTVSSSSGVLLPEADSSYYRTSSPAPSGHTVSSASRNNSHLALALLGEQALQSEQVSLAPWALVLQRSLDAERSWQRSVHGQPKNMLIKRASSHSPSDASSSSRSSSSRVSRYRSPNDIGISPDNDPLGIMTLGRRLRNTAPNLLQYGAGMSALLYLLSLPLYGGNAPLQKTPTESVIMRRHWHMVQRNSLGFGFDRPMDQYGWTRLGVLDGYRYLPFPGPGMTEKGLWEMLMELPRSLCEMLPSLGI